MQLGAAFHQDAQDAPLGEQTEQALQVDALAVLFSRERQYLGTARGQVPLAFVRGTPSGCDQGRYAVLVLEDPRRCRRA